MVLSRIDYGVVENRVWCYREEIILLSQMDYDIVENRILCCRE